ncbi:MAG: redoxin domain-containing protein [Oculatellaceae cyanobacterium Prado106]|jgi:cold shock CspA family protein/peroxiredoxin|nr:redoxin domain-containing protein [Oculatellaceae cyanobacterium Prado106]
MVTTLTVGAGFPDVALPNHENELVQLSSLTQPSLMDRYLGFTDGYPLIVVFYRGFFCPRDRQQLPQLVQFQNELTVNYCKLVTISVDAPLVQAAFRAGLGAQWPFLCDESRSLVRHLNILDETEGEYAYRPQPYTFVLRPDLTVQRIYNGWFFVGRPTIEELRQDLRSVMERRSDYAYEAYDTPAVKQIRIPQQEWENGVPPLGMAGLPVGQGMVRWFDMRTGNGMIARDEGGDDVFFNFTALPGQGYRIIAAGTPVQFETIQNPYGVTARNVQQQ